MTIRIVPTKPRRWVQTPVECAKMPCASITPFKIISDMIIRNYHNQASETGANSCGVRKGALCVAFYLNNPRQTECSLGFDPDTVK